MHKIRNYKCRGIFLTYFVTLSQHIMPKSVLQKTVTELHFQLQDGIK